jgi:hypothetical protein
MGDMDDWIDRLLGRTAWVLIQQGSRGEAGCLRAVSKVKFRRKIIEYGEDETGPSHSGVLVLYAEPELKARLERMSICIIDAIREAQKNFPDRDASKIDYIEVRWLRDPYERDWRTGL